MDIMQTYKQFDNTHVGDDSWRRIMILASAAIAEQLVEHLEQPAHLLWYIIYHHRPPRYSHPNNYSPVITHTLYTPIVAHKY